MSSKSFLKALGLLSACLAPAAAQTWSACNPMKNTTCTDNPALGMTYNYDFSNANNASTWNATAGNVIYTANGGEFTINKRYDSPTIQSEFYIMFGVVEVHMKAASGQGIISSIVMESDDLDEVDWEILGGNGSYAETNYFGKGNTTLYNRAIYYPVNQPLETFHNYTVHWTQDAIEWFIDSQLVRTLHYADALGGYNFPQTPMNIRLGIWAGGDPSNGKNTVEWAGGLTDFSKGPYSMYVQSVKVQDYGSGKAYHWSDQTGSFSSIKEVTGNSTTRETLTATPKQTLTISQKWSNLTPGVRIGIYSASGAFAATVAGLITFCCIRQRRQGRKEKAASEAAAAERDRIESEAFQMDPKSNDPDALPTSATPDQYNGTGHSYYEKPGAFGTAGSAVSSPPGYAGLNNLNSSSSPFNANGARSPPPNGPLPTPGAFNNARNGPYDDPSMGRNGPGSMRSNPGNGPGPAGGFSDFAPNRTASAGPPRGFAASPVSYSDNGGQNTGPRFNNGPGQSPRFNPGPGSMRSFTAPGGYTSSNTGGLNGNGNYGDGGLRSPSVPIGYADGGIRSPNAGPNYSHPGAGAGFSSPRMGSPRVQSPYGPLQQQGNGGPGPQQYGGSSGGNYFNGGGGNNGYARPGAF